MISVWPLKALLLAKKINCLGVTKITCLIQCSHLRRFSLTTFRQFTEGFLKLLSIDDLRQDFVSRKKNLYEFLRKRPPQTNNSNLEISHDQDFSVNTVEPPITATSPQGPTRAYFFCRHGGRCGEVLTLILYPTSSRLVNFVIIKKS